MIKKTDHSSHHKSKMIYEVFQVSYAVEATILKHDNFPPLQRTADQIQQSENVFYGYFLEEEMGAVVELEHYDNHIHIRSLCVIPQYFRQGIGRKLLHFVVDQFEAALITVETGHANQPAVDFYLSFGFNKDKVWMTDVGIEKISFTLTRSS